MSQHSNVSIQSYEGNPIAFDFGESHQMVNLTQMAKAFRKEPHDFLKTKQTKDFIAALNHSVNMQSEKPPHSEDCRSENLISIQNGGNHRGTWAHELIALKFAGWLSPAFELWMMEKIRELLIGKLPDKGRELREKITRAALYVGSRNKLAARMGVSPAQISNLLNGHEARVSAELRHNMESFCDWYLSDGYNKDYISEFTNTMKAIVAIKDEQIRTQLFNSFVNLQKHVSYEQ